MPSSRGWIVLISSAIVLINSLVWNYSSTSGTAKVTLASLGNSVRRHLHSPTLPTVTSSMTNPLATPSSSESNASRAAVYFLSHGGPPTIFETDGRPYKAWQDFGRSLKASPPRGLVIVSAHWESDARDGSVLVNEDLSNPLVYDFYNFPPHFYKLQFRSRGDKALSSAVADALGKAGVHYDTVSSRGLDHGVWIPLKAALGDETTIPIAQVSLPGDGSPESSAKLGKALDPLRDQGYAVIGTGQIVHNLRDLFSGRSMPYTSVFLGAAQKAATSPQSLDKVKALFQHPVYKQAHPTPEHLLPFVVASAAGEGSVAEEIWVGMDGPKDLGWGNWRWH